MNQVTLLGRLTRDPELKYTPSGKAFCRFSIAINREFNREETDFINCVAWDKRAETIAEYLRKGRRILVQGRIQTGSYDKDGQKVYTTDIIVDKFEFIDSANSNNNGQSNSSNFGVPAQTVDNSYVNDDNDMEDEDFPF